MKTCPYCAEEIQDAAIVCRFCQHDLRTPVQPPTRKTTPMGWVWLATFLGFLAGATQAINGFARSERWLWFASRPYMTLEEFVARFWAENGETIIVWAIGGAAIGFTLSWIAREMRRK